jgi:hypothetical protein
MELPQTLPAQLYLLAYDARRKRFAFDRHGSERPQWKFEFAVRSAIFTDLYLAGVVADDGGKLTATDTAPPEDAVLRGAFSVPVKGRLWPDLITSGGRGTADTVRRQLEDCGWVRTERRRLGVFASARVEIYDVDLVGALGLTVIASLRDILRDVDAPPRPLALGLIAFLAQMPLTEQFVRDQHLRSALRQIIEATVEPIRELQTSIQQRLAEVRLGSGP